MSTEPFSYRRRVAFGDCDPARIYYTPRAVDYCVEAIEAWWEAVLGESWTALLARRDLEARFLRVECEFLKPLVAGQVVRVRLQAAGAGRSRIAFAAAGEGESGETCFRAGLEACLADRKRSAMAPIPREYRDRIRRSRQSLEDAPARPGIGRPEGAAPRRSAVAGRGGAPEGLFARSRRVVYGECGISGTVYAPRVFDYAIETVGEWFEEVLGISWLELVSVRRKGAPAVAASCDYLRPMVAGQTIVMAVRVTRMGRASVAFSVEGRDAAGAACFDARMTTCFIDQDAGFRPMPIPEEFAGRIRAYLAACGGSE